MRIYSLYHACLINKAQRTLSESRSIKSVAHCNRQQKQAPMFLLKNQSKRNDYIGYKAKNTRSSENSLLYMKSASLKMTANEISNLPDSKLCSGKYSPVEKSSLMQSFGCQSKNRGNQDSTQPSTLICDIMPRKYSHINKLAQGLAIGNNDGVSIENSSNSKEILTLNSKLSEPKFKKRRNSSKVFSGSYVEGINSIGLANDHFQNLEKQDSHEIEESKHKFLKKRFSDNHEKSIEKIFPLHKDSSKLKIQSNVVKPSNMNSSDVHLKQGK